MYNVILFNRRRCLAAPSPLSVFCCEKGKYLTWICGKARHFLPIGGSDPISQILMVACPPPHSLPYALPRSLPFPEIWKSNNALLAIMYYVRRPTTASTADCGAPRSLWTTMDGRSCGHNHISLPCSDGVAADRLLAGRSFTRTC